MYTHDIFGLSENSYSTYLLNPTKRAICIVTIFVVLITALEIRCKMYLNPQCQLCVSFLRYIFPPIFFHIGPRFQKGLSLLNELIFANEIWNISKFFVRPWKSFDFESKLITEQKHQPLCSQYFDFSLPFSRCDAKTSLSPQQKWSSKSLWKNVNVRT